MDNDLGSAGTARRAVRLTRGIAALELAVFTPRDPQAMAPQLVIWCDKDGDGKLNADELVLLLDLIQRKSKQPMLRQMLAVSPEMRKKIAWHLINQFDVNGDKKLDASELSALIGSWRHKSAMRCGRGYTHYRMRQTQEEMADFNESVRFAPILREHI